MKIQGLIQKIKRLFDRFCQPLFWAFLKHFKEKYRLKASLGKDPVSERQCAKSG